MIPKRIRPYLDRVQTKTDGYNTEVTGLLSCCDSHEFIVQVVGMIQNRPFLGMRLYPDNERLALIAHCSKCGNEILVFDSDRDGYDGKETTSELRDLTKPVSCRCCSCNDFSVEIRYEYPDKNELEELGIQEIDNAFSWIWVSLQCSQCGKVYKNFIDFETA